MLKGFLSQVVLGNRIQDYAVSLGIFVGLAVAVKVADLIVISRLKKLAAGTDNKTDDRLIEALDKKGVPLLYLGALYLSFRNLSTSPLMQRIVNVAAAVVLAFLAVKLVLGLAAAALEAWRRKQGGEGAPEGAAYRGVLTVIKLVAWALALLILLDNFGVKVSALVAGLGIGGLAVAFAAQKVLGDLFSYFSIFFDRPFEIGDFVIVDDFQGTVEHIGIKSTRVRSLSGEQLIFSNADLTSSRLRNYKRMVNRRVVFKLAVPYGTEAAKLRMIPALVEGVIRTIPGAIFDRAHFASFGDYSLAFEAVYLVEGGDYGKYMDIQQEINLKILEGFASEGIGFAYPTQTIRMERG